MRSARAEPRADDRRALIPYRHTQVGWRIVAGSAVGLVLAVVLVSGLSPATREAVPWMPYLLFGLILGALATFGTLTTEVDAREVRFRFGAGIVRRRLDLADILKCEQVRTRVWWGMGVHWTPGGWLYNVGGRDAVRLTFARDRPVIIGSDEAARFKAAIEAAIAAAIAAEQAGPGK